MPSGIIINYYMGDHGAVTTTPGYRMLMGVGRIIIYYILPNLIHHYYANSSAASSISRLFV
jgi:hypothetical protein